VAKVRSPNYPSLTLFEAIDRVRKIYNAEHTHVAAKDVVAKDLGYSTLNGASLTVIGALKRYGFLEDSGDGLKVSANAVTILELEEEDPSYKAAIRTAAYQPTFFSELRSEYGENLPSDGNLRHHLIRKGFQSKAADEVIRIYRDNLELLEDEEDGYNGPEVITVPAVAAEPETAKTPAPGKGPVRSYTFALSPDSKVDLVFHGEITDDSLKALRDYVDITVRVLGGLKGEPKS
jgi:hypothetical protein